MDEISRLTAQLVQRVTEHEHYLHTRTSELEDNLKKREGEVMAKLEKDREALEAERAAFEKERDLWRKQVDMVNRRAQAAKDKVKLCVGGACFVATRDTLISTPGTFFSHMLGSSNWQPEEDGTYFIDRDPVLFPRILHFLRSGNWNLGGLSKTDLEDLAEELDFYQIPFGATTEDENIGDIWLVPNPSAFSIDGQTITYNVSSAWQNVSTTRLPKHSKKVTWEVAVKNIGEYNLGMIGICEGDKIPPTGNHLGCAIGGIYQPTQASIQGAWPYKRSLGGAQVVKDSSVLFEWDTDACTLVVSVDNTRVAEFWNLPEDIRPCISFWGQGSSVELHFP